MIERRAFLGAALLLAAAPAAPAAAQQPATRPQRRAAPRESTRAALPLVVIDPGHGGADPGAIGPQGTQEKRVVLAVAQELRRRLEAEGRCRVAMTRTTDVFVPLRQRVEFARRREATLLLSLHADALPPGQAAATRGASVYTLSTTASDPLAAALARRENLADRAGGLPLPSVSPEVQRILLSLMRAETRQGSERIARHTLTALRGEVPLLTNPHRRAGFMVLKAPDVPSVLVELGFISHPGDEALLRRPAWRARLADRLAEAVHAYIGRRIVT